MTMALQIERRKAYKIKSKLFLNIEEYLYTESEKSYRPLCYLCGSDDDLMTFKGNNVTVSFVRFFSFGKKFINCVELILVSC